MEAVDGLPPVPGLTDVKEHHLIGEPPSDYVESSETCQKSNGVADITTLLESADAGYAVAVSEVETLQSVHSLLQEGMFESGASATAALPDAVLPHAAELLDAMETSAAVEHLLGTSNTSDEVAEVLAAQSILSEQVQVETEQEQAEIGQEQVETKQEQVETEQEQLEIDQEQAETRQEQAETEQTGTTVLEEITTYEVLGESVTFTTEVLVEKSDAELDETAAEVVNAYNHSNDLLHDLGQGMELSEALRSSDNLDSIENNNCSEGGEVFNKEELLDILEGNNDVKALQKNKELALNQLSRLKKEKKTKSRRNTRHAKKELEKKAKIVVSPIKKEVPNLVLTTKESNIDFVEISQKVPETKEGNIDITEISKEAPEPEATECSVSEKKDDSIVDNLVKDWDDDEPSVVDGTNETVNESTNLDNLNLTQETIIDQEDTTKEATMDTPAENAGLIVKESVDEAQPARRQSRVIKKKVPFDPDNPPTFTKKVIKKEKDTKESSLEKEHTPTKKEQSPEKKVKVQTENQEAQPKKTKTDSIQRSNSKSPVSKMQWKKPTPKNGNTGNGKQLGRRLTEVDKLLMDEGAVNMIYQLTPEAGKGKKNMRTKAEFIKKVQSTDGNEMKFRERKKEIKSDDAEAKKISGGKQRSSMSSSVKSPVATDDVETHSADDSIIYRRHSSSSYSDCMSPRRMSDVDPAAVQAATRSSRQPSASKNSTLENSCDQSTSTDVFTNDFASEPPVTPATGPEILLTMKDKLNKKLSQALLKRKREMTKTEKGPKQKKLAKEQDIVKVEKTDAFKYVSVTFDQRLAEICIRKTSPSDMIFAFKELDQAFQKVDSMKDISVTLLTSECGGLCSDVDLQPMLDTNMEKRTNYAYELAESIKRVLSSAVMHSKFLVSGAWGACSGVGLALLVLSDAALATDTASFSAQTVPPIPGLAAITAGPRTLPHAVVNDLVVFGRRLSTAEAAVGGLVTRMWPGDSTTVRFSATQLATLPPQSILLKKQLLSMRNTSEVTASFLLNLTKERDMLVEYWTSIEGQDVIRATLNVS